MYKVSVRFSNIYGDKLLNGTTIDFFTLQRMENNLIWFLIILLVYVAWVDNIN